MKTPYLRTAIAVVGMCILFLTASACATTTAAAKGKVYATPEAAVEELAGAVRDFNLESLLTIFGKDAEPIFVSEDPTADESQREEFLRLYDQKHELAQQGDKTRVLTIGNDAWPLPIPLVQSSAGWTWDTAAGREEIINRRIGRNELTAIQTSLAVGDAEREYYRQDRDGDEILEFTSSFRSSDGQKNGLYWKVAEGEPPSPIGELVAAAAQAGYTAEDTSLRGYKYRLLTSQGKAAPGGAYDYVDRGNQIGGYAVLAYPAEYGDSGVMTFMTSHAGVVYQKDLGRRTAEKAVAIKSFDPAGWSRVSQQDLAVVPELDAEP